MTDSDFHAHCAALAMQSIIDMHTRMAEGLGRGALTADVLEQYKKLLSEISSPALTAKAAFDYADAMVKERQRRTPRSPSE